MKIFVKKKQKGNDSSRILVKQRYKKKQSFVKDGVYHGKLETVYFTHKFVCFNVVVCSMLKIMTLGVGLVVIRDARVTNFVEAGGTLSSC